MPAPQTYIQQLIARVAVRSAERSETGLIVAAGKAAAESLNTVAYLNLQAVMDVWDVTFHDQSGGGPLPVEAKYKAVLIAADSASMMQKLGRLCAGYRRAGIPVVVIAGWPAPMDAEQFRKETVINANMTTAAMFDVVANYCRGGNPGDILEFGTFQGHTLQCAYHAFNRRGIAKDRRFIGFDSFAGIIGTGAGENFDDGNFATSEESLKFANVLAQVPEERVVIVNGPYSVMLGSDVAATRARLEPVRAAVVHIDCDVEAPAKLALDFVTPYLHQGALLLFDEYDQHFADNSKGERAALRAWLKENPNFEVEPYRTYHARARSFIVHKSS